MITDAFCFLLDFPTRAFLLSVTRLRTRRRTCPQRSYGAGCCPASVIALRALYREMRRMLEMEA